MNQFKTRIVSILFACSIITVSMLFYFIIFFDDPRKDFAQSANSAKTMVILGFSEVRKENSTLKQSFEKKISAKLSSLDEIPVSDELKNFILELGKDLKDSKNYESIDFRKIWLSAKKWIKARQIVPANPTGLSSVIKALEKAEIIKSDIIRKGTQLKLLLTLKNDQKVIFKPKRYDRSYITDGIYSGADRHNGEIIGLF